MSYKTNTRSFITAASTIPSDLNPKPSTTNQSAGGIISTSSSRLSTTQIVSSPIITENNMSSTKPSKEYFSIHFSSKIRPQTFPTTTTVSSRPDQETARTSTNTVTYPSTTNSHHSPKKSTSFETANKASRTNKIATQVGIFSSKTTPTSILPSINKQTTTPDVTTQQSVSITRLSNSLTNTLTTTTVYQNENTNEGGATNLAGSSTQSATTGKPTGKSLNRITVFFRHVMNLIFYKKGLLNSVIFKMH